MHMPAAQALENPQDRDVVQLPTVEDLDLDTPIADPYTLELADINPANARLFAEDKFEAYFKRLREEDPVHLNETDFTGRYWNLTRYEDIKAVDQNDAQFSSAKGFVLGPRLDARLPEDSLSALNLPMFIGMDNPQHNDQRKTVAPIVGPSGLARMQPIIRERVQKILDSLPVGEEFDWVQRVSIELTTQMLATLFDFPFEERSKLTYWSDVATAQPGSGVIDSEEERNQAMIECVTYFAELFAERKANPGHDLISMLAHGDHTKHMNPMEHLGNLLLLIVGGNDTTRNSLSGGVYALNRYPQEYQKLRDNHELVANLVPEIIRWQTPLAHMRRTANEDCELGGKQIKAGDQLVMWYVSGNRDERMFPRGDELIIDRPNARQHLSFGFGVHRCMGNRLAEMQLRIAWEEIMQRFSHVEVVGEPHRHMSSFVKGYTRLPVVVHPK
jgi:cytochrome P450